jgi:uncharacterized protein YjbI with pentapeptide repeats
MANPRHLELLGQGVEAWNSWRSRSSDQPDLEAADLRGAQLGLARLYGANLQGADLRGAVLMSADVSEAHLAGATLRGANLRSASFERANLTNADLRQAILDGAELFEANLTGSNLAGARLVSADLRGAELGEADLSDADLTSARLYDAQLVRTNLRRARLYEANLRTAVIRDCDLREADLSLISAVGTDFRGTDLTGCRVYGLSAWDVQLDETRQESLVITPLHQPEITVDDLEVAQFIYLLLNNRKIRKVVDTITSKVVLILGRFTAERKAVLDALREALRGHDYTPVVFDFEKPASRGLTETVATLAHLARFVVADITDARSIPQELQRFVPDLPSLPVVPLLLDSQQEYGMFTDFRPYPWVLEPCLYASTAALIASLDARVIAPVERKLAELRGGAAAGKGRGRRRSSRRAKG